MRNLFFFLLLALILVSGCTPPQETRVPDSTSVPATVNTSETPFIKTPSHPATETSDRLPLYPGTVRNGIPDKLQQSFNENKISQFEGYLVQSAPVNIMTWYRGNTPGWKLENEVMTGTPGSIPLVQVFRKDSRGILIFTKSNFSEGNTLLVVASGDWTNIECCGRQFFEKPGIENETGKPGPAEGVAKDNPVPTQTQPDKTGDLMYAIYPDTDRAPVLELFWGPPDLSMDNIARFTPYGIWEGPYEPAYEMQFYTFSSHDPVYAPCPGTIVNIFGGPDPNTGNFAGGITIRYGRNYSVTLQHVVDILPDMKVGSKIEAKTLVGYTQGQMGVGWWEIEAATRIGNVIRTLPPYELFSPESKKKLDAIIPAAKKNESSPYSDWTVIKTDVPYDPEHGQGSWIQELGGEKEFWASGERMGIKGDPDSLADFLKAKGMELLIPHLIGNGPGQPAGPTPGESSNGETPVLSLPFSNADTPYDMMPMGETINHPKPENPFGHPGIDFMWNKSMDIIACTDGTVIQVQKTESHNKWDVFVETGNFKIGYTTLESVDEKTKVGVKVVAGQKIGEPGSFAHYMIHWELDSLANRQRICPMAYLDDNSRQRLVDIWSTINWPEMKKQFPNICNGDYRCDFCRTNGY